MASRSCRVGALLRRPVDPTMALVILPDERRGTTVAPQPLAGDPDAAYLPHAAARP